MSGYIVKAMKDLHANVSFGGGGSSRGGGSGGGRQWSASVCRRVNNVATAATFTGAASAAIASRAVMAPPQVRVAAGAVSVVSTGVGVVATTLSLAHCSGNS